jgi:glycosidase
MFGKVKLSLFGAVFALVAVSLLPVSAQDYYPSGASDPVYGLQSRADEPGFSYTPSPEDWRDINIYQLFTDRFASSGQTVEYIRNRGWYVDDWNGPEGTERDRHHGGDWEGLRQNIPYLKGMGVNAIWMSAVQLNDQGRDTRFTPYHMYHPTDFWKVDPALGTFEDLKNLIDELHANGIYVILDVVINHTADKNGLRSGEDDKWYWPNGGPNFGWWDESRKHADPFDQLDHFHNNGTINNWDASPENLLGQFKGTDDLKTESEHVTYWITEAFKNLIDATDCDGFRVDAIKHVEFNWVMKWADDIRKHAAFRGKDDFILFGELFSYDNNALASYCRDEGYAFNSALFFPMSQTFKSVFVDGSATRNLTDSLNARFGYGEGTDRLVTFIDNHDVNRIGLQAGGDVGYIEWIMQPALTFLYTATPVPCLFYGTEHAFQQGNHWNGSAAYTDYDDADWQRETMFDKGFQPGPAQGNKLAATNAPLYQHIARLNAARSQHRSLTRGDFTERWNTTGGRGPYAFTRVYQDEEALVAMNTSNDQITLTPAVGKPDGTEFVNVLNPSETATVSGGLLSVTLSGQQSKIFVAGVTQDPVTPGSVISDNVDPVIDNSAGGATVTITYDPSGNTLSNAVPVYIFLGFSKWTLDVSAREMTANGDGTWSYEVTIPDTATEINFVFRNADETVWDNNSGSDWMIRVTPLEGTEIPFDVDGVLDSEAYEVAQYNGMKLWAALRGTKLYAATWSTTGGVNDHFLHIADDFANPTNHPWAKAGRVYFDTANDPWIGADPDGAYGSNLGASGSVAMGANGEVVETVVDLVEVFGYVPNPIYLAAAVYGRADGSEMNGQVPALFGNSAIDLEPPEFQPLNPESIRDEDGDGVFDIGVPELRTVVNGNERDADYDLRRFFIDELLKEEESITVKFRPNAPLGAVVSNVEVFSNLNRRDFAVLEEDPNFVTATSRTYYRAYPMSGPDAEGFYSVTLPVNRCGAYRLQARYRIDNGGYIYYTDHAQRRDCAIVVSPRKALQQTMYEVNPLIVEAKDTTFAGRSTFLDLVNDPDIPGESGGFDGRPDALNKYHYQALGVDLLWLQPIHPIGIEGRDINPETGEPFDPGSPYAVRDYWSVAPMLGRGAGESAAVAMQEFQTFVERLDSWGIGVMMDGTFNHSAPDAIMGQGAVDLGFVLPGNENQKIRDFDTRWYAREGFPGQPAASTNDIAVAPDRNDFGNWTDVREFYFGRYDTLVLEKGEQLEDGTYPDSAYRQAPLLERDHFLGHSQDGNYTRQVWEYFAYYPIYWLEQSGHPVGTPKSESWRGIDGLRCDFAQGLPSQFWEYAINKTRSVKWDFLFMAESLDGNRNVGDNPDDPSYRRHGVGYRSARHFDILNENIVFYWRDQYFNYPNNGGTREPAVPSVGNTFNAYSQRRQAFDNVVLLNNLVSHDEVFPHNDPYRLLYAYAQVAALDGVPMLIYGQEAGAQNDKDTYWESEGNYGSISANRNFAEYELNFGKSIPNFKVYNHMTNIWNGATRDWALQDLYGRINRARQGSPALQSQNNYFLNTTDGGFHETIFAVAKVQQPGLPVGQQDVVLTFVNTDHNANPNPAGLFDLDAPFEGGNYFGIEAAKTYNVRDLVSTNTALLWPEDRTGQDLIENGLYVGLPYLDVHAHYLRLIETTPGAYADMDGDGIFDAVDTDIDGDGIPNFWEIEVSGSATGVDANAIAPNGMTYRDSFVAGLSATNAADVLEVWLNLRGSSMDVEWRSKPQYKYVIEQATDLMANDWQSVGVWTADSSEESMNMSMPTSSNAYYRVRVLE